MKLFQSLGNLLGHGLGRHFLWLQRSHRKVLFNSAVAESSQHLQPIINHVEGVQGNTQQKVGTQVQGDNDLQQLITWAPKPAAFSAGKIFASLSLSMILSVCLPNTRSTTGWSLELLSGVSSHSKFVMPPEISDTCATGRVWSLLFTDTQKACVQSPFCLKRINIADLSA